MTNPTGDPRAIMRLPVALAVVAALAAAPLRAQDDAQIGLPHGATPGAVTLEDLDGTPVDLGQWVGAKPVLLEFWATWCPLCERLFPELEAAHRQYGEQVEFIAVAVGVNQSQRSIKRHLARHPLPFRVLWDGEGDATRAYRAPTTSYVVVLDAQGRVVYTGTGEDQDIVAAVKRALPASEDQGRGGTSEN